MTENDIKTGKELLKEDFIRKNKEWMHELEIMVRDLYALLSSFKNIELNFSIMHIFAAWIVQQVKTKKKAEIQALSSFGFQYVTETYLPQKLREGDWI